MKILITLITTVFTFCGSTVSGNTTVSDTTSDEATIRKIYDEVLVNGRCYTWLRELCKDIGGRVSGSPEAEKAVHWAKQVLDSLDLDSVFLQEVMVPHWVRGTKEEAKIFHPLNEQEITLNITALGNSIGTGDQGISAEVIEVNGVEELQKLDNTRVNGKIVFLNKAMDPRLLNTFKAYGGCINQRWAGASEAAKLGAVAVIVRSLSLNLDDDPHTGSMAYEDGVKKIPAVAVSTKGAEILSRHLEKDPMLNVYIKTNCQSFPDVKSYNVIGQINGTMHPDEIILVGGHLDSWDTGEGAHDDGAGCVQSMEVLRLIKGLGIKPERTVRAVLFMSEENGNRGGIKYAEIAKEENEKHIAAIESDRGGFTPRGFDVDGTDLHLAKLQEWKSLLSPYGLHDLVKGYGGVDIRPLKPQGVALIGYVPDPQRYFDYHHSEEDVFENVNKRELELGAASMTSLVYLISKYGMEGEIRVENIED